MADQIATDLDRRREAMFTKRATWHSHWQEIAERIWPSMAQFTNRDVTKGSKKTEKIYDAKPALALERFASSMEAMLTPRASRWHLLKPSSPRLFNDQVVKEYLEELTRILFQMRYRPKANYASQQHETYMSLGAFGTGPMFVGEGLEDNLPFYRAVPLAELFVSENQNGFVDVAIRDFMMSARAIAQRFKENFDKLPTDIKNAANNEGGKTPEDEFNIIHATQPRDDRDMGAIDRLNMAFASIYYFKDKREVIDIGGEHEFPYPVSRYITTPGETYGRGPSMIVLPDIKMLNEMAKETIVATHLANRPPLIGVRDGVLKSVALKPGAFNRGGMDKMGNQLVKALETGADPAVGEVAAERRMRTVDDAFLVNLMRVLQDHPNMTATQALLLAQERGVVMGPTMGRQQSEAHGPMIERELNILIRGGWVPEPPEQLIAENGEYEIEFDSPINRAQRSDEGMAILRTIEILAPLSEIAPQAWDNIDTDEIFRLVPEINGAPASILRSIEERDEKREEEAQARQQQQLIDAAPNLARAAKDATAATQALGGGDEGGGDEQPAA